MSTPAAIANDARLHRNGRWAAILVACRDRPLAHVEIFDAVGRPEAARKRERRKVRYATNRLAEMGHLNHVLNGFKTSPAALQLLAAAPEHQPQSPADPGGEETAHNQGGMST